MAARRGPDLGPAAAAGLIALVLMLALFPNPFHVPRDIGRATAAYAPVPGVPSEDVANFSAPGLPISPGLGYGRQDGMGSLPSRSGDPITQFAPRQKPCYGDPPRQTFDPISPPCVPFFEGNNGGRTYPGVARDDIEVVLYTDWVSKEIDLTEPYDANHDGDTEAEDWDRYNLVRTLKAQLRFFQERFQTYGRRVHVVTQPGKGQGIGECQRRAADAAGTIHRRPFAAIWLGRWNADCYRKRVLRSGIVMYGMNYDVPSSTYQRSAPLLWGVFPDQNSYARMSGSLICQMLRGGRARFASDPGFRARERTFGMLLPENSWWGPERAQVGTATLREIEERCGISVLVRTYEAGSPESVAATAPPALAKMRDDGVTTLICECDGDHITIVMNAATGQGYFPEWYWDNPHAMSVWAETLGDRKQGSSSIGIGPRWRQPEFKKTIHYRAFKRMDPEGEPNALWNFDIYQLFQHLFTGIQAAGPDLTPETHRRGMFTIKHVVPLDPWAPTGGYGPYDARATGDYTFIDTAIAFWIDGTGREPGERTRVGCIRAMLGGRRFFAGTWPRDDRYLDASTAACMTSDGEIKDV